MPFLFELYASTREEELSRVAWTPEQKSHFLEMQFRTQHAAYLSNYESANFDVIQFNGQPVGRLYVHRRDDEIRIVDIAIKPAFRRLGIGSELIRNLQIEAGSREVPLRIHVEQNNPAKRLYDRLGFCKIGSTGVYDLMEWTKSDG